MARKKWTAQTEITDSLIRLREKRKWQVSYRRYVLERMPCESYAPYFGLSIDSLRNWFELQFTEGLSWDNFGKAWQFNHIVPATYFDFSDEEDLLLCWGFINMRVEQLAANGENTYPGIDLLSVRSYFSDQYEKTGFSLSGKMLEKLIRIEEDGYRTQPSLEAYIVNHKAELDSVLGFSHEEFNRLNQGITVKDILTEREILKKFG